VMRFALPDKKLKRVYDVVVLHPRQISNREKVAELIEELQAAKRLGDLRSLQGKLLEAISSAEEEQRRAKDRKARADLARKAVMREGRKRGSVKARLEELDRELKALQLEIEVLRRVRHQLRGVGDGLLWKAVGFNRAYAYAVSDAPGDGNVALSDPEGLKAELWQVERLWETKGALAVMHDLTNYGRIGDLTVVAPGETIKVMEVKSSGTLGSEQVRRMAEMVRFLRGNARLLKDGYSVKASTPELPSDLARVVPKASAIQP
jgi:hypothetical protein